MNPLGEWLVSESMLILDQTLAGRWTFLSWAARINPAADIEGAPDLAVEVLSPSDTPSAVRRKAKQCLRPDARKRKIEVWSTVKDAHVLTEEHPLESRLLPGFPLRIGDLF